VLEGLIGSLDGRVVIRERMAGSVAAFAALGANLAERILAEGGRALLDEAYRGEPVLR